jgi:hypothetical protein
MRNLATQVILTLTISWVAITEGIAPIVGLREVTEPRYHHGRRGFNCFIAFSVAVLLFRFVVSWVLFIVYEKAEENTIIPAPLNDCQLFSRNMYSKCKKPFFKQH